MEAARAFLEMHQRDGDQLFSRIVTGDESRVHHSTPETKRQSMVWKKSEESAPKKAKVTISAGKVMAMENFKWEIFTHPPYSPELAPSDFHLFPALKWHLGGKHFANDDEVQAEENHWLRRQDTAWYNSGIKKLLQRYQKCLDRNVHVVQAMIIMVKSLTKHLITTVNYYASENWKDSPPSLGENLTIYSEGTMTAQRYVDDVLRPVTLPYLQVVPNALYQQDNARPHTARISQQALQDVQMLPWPPYSPDLSPIEHVWDIIGRRLHALPQPRSEDELWQMVEREWRAIPQDAHPYSD
ncbi:hypothetical protein LAZ67_5002028 [Cordylochernes scorpioides]|uniref:Tc1-like transposase DDE domain-containing protein n=1 Tax=Cordylochernes scorpioides TaxID=51811 RepID=A0ABY6KFZ6_9ARAC|nr:hypothetical protein LAZ67_5002028 [Cordylochernes scorpioides]